LPIRGHLPISPIPPHISLYLPWPPLPIRGHHIAEEHARGEGVQLLAQRRHLIRVRGRVRARVRGRVRVRVRVRVKGSVGVRARVRVRVRMRVRVRDRDRGSAATSSTGWWP